jgi:hypothetical protein
MVLEKLNELLDKYKIEKEYCYKQIKNDNIPDHRKNIYKERQDIYQDIIFDLRDLKKILD